MGKKNKTSGLGRSIIRDRFGGKQNRGGNDTFLHTSDLNDGYDWGRLNLQSVTEQNNLDDFLTTAELAGTEFTAEKLNIKVIQKDVHGGLPHGEELARIQALQSQHKDSIKIPRRPHWDREMSASEVDQNERAAFLDWRRSLALLQEVDGITLTPYEKNLDFWRQLWRVIERSDVIVQIVDARNPLLFYCRDLETYVSEVDPSKQCVLLVNKADFLTQSQRDSWADYCNRNNVRVAFWSAIEETKRQEEVDKLAEGTELHDELTGDNLSDSGDSADTDEDEEGVINDECVDNISDEIGAKVTDTGSGQSISDKSDMVCEDSSGGDDSGKQNHSESTSSSVKTDTRDRIEPDKDSPEAMDSEVGCTSSTDDSELSKTGQTKVNTGHLYTGPELLDFLRSLTPGLAMTTVGMVGYPNVGKSSTINAILKMKKVPVSATPGRTKHFQTLYVDKDMMLCDCPGLVFPSFVTTKAELVISGILPIDQLRDHVPPTALICQLIPRHHLEKVYGIIIAKPREGENPHRVPTAEEFLNAYGAMRGFMNARGMPDCPRSSRYVLKDYVNGKLLHCHPPPGTKAEDFNVYTDDLDTERREPAPCQVIPESSAIDREFFEQKFSTSHTRTARSGGKESTETGASEKPWKKHNNKKKKEKLRRVYGYMDKH